MALEIEWSKEARAALYDLYDYLEAEWTDDVLSAFSIKLEQKLKLISEQPTLFKASSRLEGTRECVLTKHNTIFFIETKDHIYIVSFWSNRKDPRNLNS